ncbi:MAG: AraC family transcriptional regulator ligand-binding domain-containing protein, partial [Polyangiales bacterium]
MTVPTIASGALRKLLTTLAEAGLPSSEVLAELAVEQDIVDDPDGRVPIERLHAAWEIALARAHGADAAIMAPRYEPSDYGLVGFVAMSSATLGEALGHVVRYIALWTDDPAMILDDEGTVRVVYRRRFVDGPG